MKGKLTLAAGVAIGYVVGSKQARQSYEDLKDSAKSFWTNPNVQQQVESAKQFAREQAPVAKGGLTDAAQKVTEKATSGSSGGSATSGTSGTSGAGTDPQYTATYGTP